MESFFRLAAVVLGFVFGRANRRQRIADQPIEKELARKRAADAALARGDAGDVNRIIDDNARRLRARGGVDPKQ